MSLARRKLFRFAPQICGGAALFYFFFHMISGDRGMIAYVRLKREASILKTELTMWEAKNAALENRVNLLKDEHINHDMLEECAMKTLGIVKKGDLVILIKR